MAAMELLRCGKDLEVRGEVDKAEEMYRLALAADPEHADTLSQLGLLMQTVRSNNDAAENMYVRALKADPSHMDTLQNYAIFLEEVRGDVAGAEKMYNIALNTHAQTVAHDDSARPKRTEPHPISISLPAPAVLLGVPRHARADARHSPGRRGIRRDR
ncbi:hypothetical protein T484DRAFT_1910213 [Baffinella frigidus]|nr:hypothetical protein T484DRAFT_1910213 [Cryptophyta sp. CCMP2293]